MSVLLEFSPILIEGLTETLYMTFISVAVAYLIGLPMGILLVITYPQGLMPNRIINRILGMIVNIVRSVPFIIVIVVLIPLTRFIMGTAIGSTAAIVPLVIAAVPFIARMVETTL
ncbi:MAG: methionine ABC transporter permease, partial [Defluviitaleaceae bacterium]|nr:methionine ABC transporter permease [Defluviitaleaceae bacterium]